jgi:hypothetical protein
MTYEQIQWLRSVSEDRLAQIALMLAADNWAKFKSYGDAIHAYPPEDVVAPPKFPTSVEELSADMIRRCREVYTRTDYPSSPRVELIKFLRTTYGMPLKEAKQLMEEFEYKENL